MTVGSHALGPVLLGEQGGVDVDAEREMVGNEILAG